MFIDVMYSFLHYIVILMVNMLKIWKKQYIKTLNAVFSVSVFLTLCYIFANNFFSNYCKTGIFRKGVFFGIFGIFEKNPKITPFRNFSEKLSNHWFHGTTAMYSYPVL